MRAVALGLVACVLVALPGLASAADVWTIVVVGDREITTSANDQVGDMPTANLESLAQALAIGVDRRSDTAVVRDAGGAEWHTTTGSVVLTGVVETRVLRTPAVINARGVFLPLDAIAALAGRRLVLDGRRAFLFPDTGSATVVATPAVAAASGWQTLTVAKTPQQIAETRRVEGDTGVDTPRSVIKDVLPKQHQALTVDLGAGLAGRSAASELSASGSVGDLRIALNALMTYGVGGPTFQSGRLTLREPDGRWLIEAGDLVSEVRGAARGARFGTTLASWWRPSVGVYVRSDGLSRIDRGAVTYRDEIRLPGSLTLRSEAVSDGSAFVGTQWVYRRTTFDTFWRSRSAYEQQDRGASVAVDIWKGITAHVGGRVTTGSTPDRWYVAGFSVPVADRVMLTLDRTRTESAARDTNAFGVVVPIGSFRIMQRYQWTDVAFVRDPELTGIGYRQLQSMASFSPVRRVQLSYQLATQWSASTTAQQWTELQAAFTVARATSVHAVTGVPGVLDTQRFRIGVQQGLPRGFRLAVEYGRLPAFQAPTRDVGAEPARLMVVVKRSFSRATPAGGSTVRGRVIDQRGLPVAGAAVTLGPYVAASRTDGSYQFPHVPAGRYDLALDPARLPTPYAADGTIHELDIVRGRDTERDLVAVPLNAIRGHVFVDRDGNGEFDPGEGMSDVVLRLSSGATTMTDRDGAYGFYELHPQQYGVSVDVERLNRNLVVVSDRVIDVDLADANASRTTANFRLAPREKPIMMQLVNGQ